MQLFQLASNSCEAFSLALGVFVVSFGLNRCEAISLALGIFVVSFEVRFGVGLIIGVVPGRS